MTLLHANYVCRCRVKKEFIWSLSQVLSSELLKTLGISWVIRVSLLCNGMTHSGPLDRFHWGLVLRRTNHGVIGANLTPKRRRLEIEFNHGASDLGIPT